MKKFTVLASLFLLLPQSGFAASLPGFSQLQAKVARRIASNAPVAPSVANGCANFSGEWVGKCAVGDETHDSKVKFVQNGCEILAQNDEIIEIGALTSGSVAAISDGKAYATAGAVAVDWNEKRDELVLFGTGFVKAIGSPANFGLAIMGKMGLVGDKLVSEGELLGVKVKCVYGK